MDALHVVHDVLEGPALLDVKTVTCLPVSVPVVYHDTGWGSGDIAAPLLTVMGDGMTSWDGGARVGAVLDCCRLPY